VATEQDAARDRVLAARSDLASKLEVLEASARSAVDIPARIRESPAKAAAIAGAAGFLLLRGPERIYRFVRKAVTGSPAPMPKRMLPKQIEKSLRALGDDGEKVRGTIERDFAEYAKKAEKDRRGLLSALILALARPLVTRGAKAAGEYLFSPSREGVGTRLDEVRARALRRAAEARERAEHAGDAGRERVARTRAAEDRPDTTEDTEPTGI
jgi:ElaB/YqjD/DUF883 family membrane-anchored ribosome-binding protein